MNMARFSCGKGKKAPPGGTRGAKTKHSKPTRLPLLGLRQHLGKGFIIHHRPGRDQLPVLDEVDGVDAGAE